MKNIKQEFSYQGKSICRLRIIKGLGQKEVAAKLKISQQAYSKMERHISLKLSAVNAILAAMDSTLDELNSVTLIVNHLTN